MDVEMRDEYQPDELRAQLPAEERTLCEIYSRVMGYHRPITEWNQGKQQEFADRKMYTDAK